MMMKNRYHEHEIQYGQKALQEFMDELQSLDVLPMLQPAGIEPESYMCAANMGALMATVDDGDLVADIAFHNVPPGCPELLGIRRADPDGDLEAAREIGKSLILDLLYGAIAPGDVGLLHNNEAAKADCAAYANPGDVEDPAIEGHCKIFVTRDGNRYEVLRKYMQRPLSQTELQRLKDHENSVAKQKAEQAMPVIMTNSEIEAANLDAFYSALSDAGITGIIGRHDGYEDGGRFEGIRAVCGQKLMDLPTLEVQYAEKDAQGRQGHASQKAIRQVLYNVVDDILSDIQDGYCFFHGTFFQFRCDVKTRKVHIKARGGDLNGEFLKLDLVC